MFQIKTPNLDTKTKKLARKLQASCSNEDKQKNEINAKSCVLVDYTSRLPINLNLVW